MKRASSCVGRPVRARASVRAAGEQGFTLLEIVLAMGILLVGVTVILGLLAFGAALSRTAALRTAAAESAEAVVADLEETFFPLLSDGRAGPPVDIVDRPVPGHPELVYRARGRPNPSGPLRNGEPLEYLVDVELRWKSAGEQKSRRFTILLLREVPFGERMRRRFLEHASPPAAGSVDP